MKFPKIRFVWHSPKIYFYAGLYLKVNDKRYRVFKAGVN